MNGYIQTNSPKYLFFATGRSIVQRSLTECGYLGVIKKPRREGLDQSGLSGQEKKVVPDLFIFFTSTLNTMKVK
jgi:hypothetical protein